MYSTTILGTSQDSRCSLSSTDPESVDSMTSIQNTEVEWNRIPFRETLNATERNLDLNQYIQPFLTAVDSRQRNRSRRSAANVLGSLGLLHLGDGVFFTPHLGEWCDGNSILSNSQRAEFKNVPSITCDSRGVVRQVLKTFVKTQGETFGSGKLASENCCRDTQHRNKTCKENRDLDERLRDIAFYLMKTQFWARLEEYMSPEGN
ncbi:hypothetical protein AVEN_150821-1 [Araneus ventricosus]|uniref:Uncharacterized protein n=1 Tax=Araneus ventricosus TaxID=182803 RepID=A0A4Y2U673_ARAVE|nr:hypothetical protein AVEN_150821-1 [Araneus ventricosus]